MESTFPPSRDPLRLLTATGGELRRRLVLLTLARLGVATVLLGVVLAFGNKTPSDPFSRAALTVVLAIYVASLAYAAVLARGRDLRSLAAVQIGLDLAAWTALVTVTGGPASPISFFFALSALSAALVLGAGAARVTAVAAIATYGAVAVVESWGLLPRVTAEQLARAPLSRPELVLQIVLNVVAILLVAALGSALASRLSRAGGALAQLEASRDALAALYEDVVRSIPVALLTCSPAGVIQGANPGAAALFGLAPDALLGTPVTRWLPFVPADAFVDPRGSAARPRAGDETLATAPGSPRVAYLAAPLYARDGRARGGLVVIEDRSDAETLREAVARAERLAVLGRLAAGLAHEIRNPLGAISGCVELVRENGAALPAQDRELLATVLREVSRLNDLVTDMLVFARPRPPEAAPTDVAALAREVVTLANAPGARAGVALVEPADEAAVVAVVAEVDAAQVRQVLWNLVRNAIQASPEGGRVEVAARARPGGGVELSVADRGRGIAPGLRDRLFDEFYSETARGTGLGLAIVKQIADAHAAAVEVRDRDGGGTEFAVVFSAPRPDGVGAAPATDAGARPPSVPAPASGASGR